MNNIGLDLFIIGRWWNSLSSFNHEPTNLIWA